MATVAASAPAGAAMAPARPAGMTPGELVGDTLRSPLAQTLAIVVALGMLLLAVSPAMGWRETYRGSPLPTQPAPELALADQLGQRVSLGDLRGGAVVLTFIYTRCTSDCPLTMANLAQSMRLLGQDARTASFVAVTVDPQRDDPPTLQAYAERFGLADRWHLLTGSTEEIGAVLAAYHAQPVAEAAARAGTSVEDHGAAHAPTLRPGEIVHPSVVLLIDREGYLRYAYGPGFTPEDLAHDVQLLQRDLGGPMVPFPLY